MLNNIINKILDSCEDDQQKGLVKNSLVIAGAMRNTREKFQIDIEKKEKEWIKSLMQLGDYREIYCFCKQNIKDEKRFNSVMLEVVEYLNERTEHKISEEESEKIKNKSNAVVNEIKTMKEEYAVEYLEKQKQLVINTAKIGNYSIIYSLGKAYAQDLDQFCTMMGPVLQYFNKMRN